MEKILVIGSSEHARVIIDIIEQEGKYHISGILDPKRPIGEKVSDYPVLGKEEDILAICTAHQIKGAVIAIGDNWTRSLVAEKIHKLAPLLPFVSVVHPFTAIGKNVTIGKGTVVMAGAIINPGTRVGNFCIINTRASIDHDSVIENYASIAPGVTAGGCVHVGEYSAISLGANIIHGISIGHHTVIGAGALVNKNIENGIVAYGVPAKEVRKRSKGEKYL